MRRFISITVVSGLSIACRGYAADRGFTVRDSIEMSTFSEPRQTEEGSAAKCSPDGKYFVVVTTRGLIDSDRVESTLRIYESGAVLAYVRGKESKAPVGRILTRMTAVPKVIAYSAYESIISEVRWSQDSRALLFLGQDPDGNRRLYRLDVEGIASHVLTPPGYDVAGFEEVGKTIAFEASNVAAARTIVDQASQGVRINQDTRSLTGLGFVPIMFPELNITKGAYKYLSLGVIRDSHLRLLPGAESNIGQLSIGRYKILSISPRQDKLVMLLPVKNVPQTWTLYTFASDAFAQAYPIVSGKADVSPEAAAQLTQYVVVDLNSGKASALVDAPFGFALGYPDAASATWSEDGRKILVTGTFLPLTGTEQDRDRRRIPCNAALVDTQTLAANCVTYSTYRRDMADNNSSKRLLREASFGKGEQNVKLEFVGNDSKRESEEYHFADGAWTLEQSGSDLHETAAASDAPGRQSELPAISVKQELDQPPVLWAADRMQGPGRELLNPNPQLRGVRLGQASVFHWKDKTGYEWTGGLVRPVDYQEGRRYPLVIQTYSFHQHQFMADGMDTTAEAALPLASRGMVVLQINKRSDQAITDQEALIQLPGFEAAIDRLASDGLVDPSRVGIIGFSRGCYYVESALTHMSERFAAATTADGSDQSYVSHRIFDGGAIAHQDDSIYGVKPQGEGLKTWIKEAPGFNMDRIQTPLRIEAIAAVSILTEWELYASLREQAKPVDLIYFPDGQHILQRPLERMASQQGNVDWFSFWLQGFEDPDPAKSAQYQRWEHLCDMQIAEHAGRPTFCVSSKH